MNARVVVYFMGFALLLLGCIFDNIFMFLFGLFGIFDSHMSLLSKELKDINNKLEEIYERQRWRY